LYCYARTYSQYPGEGRVVLYSNTLEKLRKELCRKRMKPAFVYFSPSTDPFQPVAVVLTLAYDIFSFLIDQNIGIAFVTKGKIPDKHMALFGAHPGLIRAQIGLISLNNHILQVFEPKCPPAEVRLRQIGTLTRMGVQTEARLDPILPGLTDDSETLESLFRALRDLAVKRVALNVLYLRPALFKTLCTQIPDKHLSDVLLRRYVPGVKIRVCEQRFSQIALARQEREEIFRRTIGLAQHYGIECCCCGCMNPDISNENCNLTGVWQPTTEVPQQLELLQKPT
jgi:DNA repair photolyase